MSNAKVHRRTRRLSASKRVALAMLLALAIAIGSLILIAVTAIDRSLAADLDRTLVREAQAYSAAMQGAPTDQALADATRTYLEARGDTGAGPTPVLSAVFADGRVISNSSLKLERARGNSAAREPTSSPAGIVYVQLDGEQYRVLSAPVVTSTGTRVGVFQTALATQEIHAVATNVAATLGITGLIVFAFGAALSLWAARRSLSPLRQMAESASAVTHASPGTRIDYEGPADELGTLADALDSMLDRLETAFAEQRRFVADASHELRTPLAIIRGNIELLRSGKATGPEAEEALAMLDEEARRMSRLVDELLALARLQGEQQRPFQPLDASTLVHEASARARALANREIVVSCVPDAWIMGDPDLLDQALLNIVRNAVAHTSDGGRIMVACSASDRRVRISVADDGPGIPPEDLPRVFDRFYRSRTPRSSETGGSGLGLAITSRLVELHSGVILVDNVQPHGAVFTIDLPRTPAPR